MPDVPLAPATTYHRVRMVEDSCSLAPDSFLQLVGFFGSVLGDAKLLLLSLFTWVTCWRKRSNLDIFRCLCVSCQVVVSQNLPETLCRQDL